MPINSLRIATRKSPLALWQANYVGETLKQYWPGLHIELIPLVTSGDKLQTKNWLGLNGKGLFVKELEEALLAKKADIAVHSMKDVPATFPSGLRLASICKRHTPVDALIALPSVTLADLPTASIVGTSSLRRQAQLLAVRPDLHIKLLRGNINTRLEKLHTGDYHAIVLAAAGLERMNKQGCISELLSTDFMLPACGQGALGIECRDKDNSILSLIQPLNDELSALCVNTERQVSALLGGNCSVPLAVFCSLINDHLLLRAKVLSPDGKTVISDVQQGSQAAAPNLAAACASSLLARGAKALLAL